MTLVIDPEFKSLIPPLAPDELVQLEASLLSEGCRDALVVWAGQNVLVDGHNRYELCTRHNLPYQTVERSFDSREDVIIWMVQNQFARRNLQAFVRGELALRMKEAIAQKAKAQQGVRTDILQNFAEGFEPINTRQEVAKAADVSHETIRKVEHVTKSAPEPIKQAARAGELSTHRAFQITQQLEKLPAEHRERAAALSGDELEKYAILARLYKSMGSPETNGTYEEIIRSGGFQYGKDMEKRCEFWTATVQEITKALDSVAKHHAREESIRRNEERTQKAQTLPVGTYNVIYADPPWQYDNAITSWGPARLHYGDMSLDDICALPRAIDLRIEDNAVLFLWVTNPFLQDAFKVIEAWGFEYKTNIAWVKTDLQKPGSGFYVRGRHELLFICTRGSFTPLDKHITPPIGSVIEAPLQEHSRKPDEVYSIIERLYPACNYVELFARRKRDGWDAFGNEVGEESHAA